MRSQKNEIKSLLKNYCYYKALASNGESGNKLKEKVDAVEKCLNALDIESQRIIRELYFERVFADDIARK